jgi:hypothetical protein
MFKKIQLQKESMDRCFDHWLPTPWAMVSFGNLLRSMFTLGVVLEMGHTWR